MKKLIKFLLVLGLGVISIGCGGSNINSTTKSYPPSGSLDKSFGDDGKVLAGGSKDDSIYDIISNSDGTIYICGETNSPPAKGYDSFVAKLSQKGNFVSSFGQNGVVLSGTDKDDSCKAIAKDANGNIYATGSFTNSSNKDRGYIVKFKPDGSLDKSFNGSGYVNLSMDSYLNTIAIQSDGKIVVAGEEQGKALTMRFNSNGTADSSFGSSGKVTIGNGTAKDEVNDIAIDSSGNIVLVGKTVVNSKENVAVARLTPSGQIDTNFGNNGGFFYNSGDDDNAKAVKIDSSGKIVLSGMSGNSMLLIKLNSNGSLDTSFGAGGVVKYSDSPYCKGYDLALDTDDNILVTGFAGQSWTSVKMALWRYNIEGNLDKTFNKTGILTYSGGYSIDVGMAVTLDDDGKILVGGYSYQGNGKESDEIIWRVNP